MLSRQFMNAITNDDVLQVKHLINSHEILQEIQWAENDHKFLSEAISLGHYEIAKVLLEKIFKVNNEVQDCTTLPLHYAAKNSSLEMVILLLLRGANVNVKDENETTPLHFAVEQGNEEMSELLLGYGACPHSIDQGFNMSAFQLACIKGNPKIVKSFINHGCNINERFQTADSWECPKGSSPLQLAVLHKKFSVVKLLINLKADINALNEENESALHLACGESDEETVVLLLTNNALVNVFAKDNTTPLYRAVKTKNINIVKHLLEAGAFIIHDSLDISVNICRPIYTIIASGYSQIVQLLINYGLNVNMNINETIMDKYHSFLHIAVKYNKLEIAQILLDNNAELELKNEKGRTPLHVATENSNKDMILLLLRYGANIYALDNLSYTPFHIACAKNNFQIVQMFLSLGIDINSETEIGEAPLHLACAVGDIDTVKLLIKHDSSIHLKTDDGSTPLHIAVENGHENVVELLLACGADTEIQNSDGKTCLELAVENQYVNIVKSLLWYNHDNNNLNNRKSFLKALLQYERHGRDIFGSFIKYKFTVRAEDANKSEILINAVKNGYYLIVEDLMNYKIDINNLRDHGNTLLHIATIKKHYDIINLLLKHGADISALNDENENPLICAVKISDLDITSTFINHGMDVSKFPELLHVVIQNWKSNSIFMIELLLKNRIDINYSNNEGLNALHLLIQSLVIHDNEYVNQCIDSVVEIIDYLLKNGTDIDTKSKIDECALHMVVAIISNAYKIENLMNTILKYNPELDSKNTNGCTPLHLACIQGNCIMISILLNAGADINIFNDLELTPLDCLFREKEYYTSLLFHSPSYAVNNLFFKLARYDEAVNAMHVHIIKLKAAKLYVVDNIEDTIDYTKTKLYSDCEAEIKEIKQIKVNRYVSLYDILIRKLMTVARYTRNRSIDDVLKFTKYKQKYPIYSNLIYNQLRKAVKRDLITTKAKESLDIASKYNLTDSCAENIFDYLSNRDLLNLVEATKIVV